MTAISQTTFSYAFSWMKRFVFWFEFHWSLFLRIQLTKVSVGSGNGLVPNKRQAITWSNAGPVYWRIFAALGETKCAAWASCQIRKIAGAHAPGMPGTCYPSPQVSDTDMHHGTCITHVPWCMPGSLTSSFLWNRRRGKTFPAFPAHAQPAILRIW